MTAILRIFTLLCCLLMGFTATLWEVPVQAETEGVKTEEYGGRPGTEGHTDDKTGNGTKGGDGEKGYIIVVEEDDYTALVS